MKKFASLITTGLGLIAICLSIFAPYAAAQGNTPGGGQALEIAPPVVTLTGNPGETINTQLSLRDIAQTNLVVKGQANDFVAAGEDGTPKLILDGDEPSPYSMKDWVGPLPTLNMVPREIQTLPITINVPSDASPGGHYAVIRFTATPPDLAGTGVSLSASLGALILVTVNGDVKQSLSVAEYSVNKDGKTGSVFQSTPINFVERLKNDGTVHLQPVGQITITDMFGKKVAAVNVNLARSYILPGSTRKFEEPLDSATLGNKRLFGRYKATLNMTYGTDQKTLSSTITFWIIPYKLIAIVIGVLIAGFFIFRFTLKRYNQRVIKKSRRY